jgi:hypothetical protein
MLLLRRFRLLVLGVLCLAVLPAASALAAGKGAARPTISSVGPAKVGVGDTLTIRGRNFLAGKNRNTVIFKHNGGPAVSVKAGQATRTRIAVVVPLSLDKYLSATGGVIQPARFRIRVRARTLSKITALKRSALIGPAGDAAGGAGSAACALADAANALDGLAGGALDDVVGSDPCAGDGGDGAAADDFADDPPDPAGDDPDAGAPDPWDSPDAGAASGPISG